MFEDDLIGDDRLEAIARSVTTEDQELDTPPADLWGAIESAAGESAAARSPQLDQPMSAPSAPVVNLAARRRLKTLARPLAAAAAVVLVIGAAVVVANSRDDVDTTTVASADFDVLAEGYEGDATLVQKDGRYVLDVDIDDLPAVAGGYHELWLIKDLETGEMQSLGIIDSSADIEIPAGLDPAEYAVVDISIESFDGVPTHSGASVLRGGLDI